VRHPILVCSVKDLQTVIRAGYKHIAFMEHGVGITYGSHSAYAGGRGARTQVELFLAPNEIVQRKTLRALPNAKSVVVGTPKMDEWTPPPAPPQMITFGEGRKVVCISFHWNGSGVAPEAGTAFQHFKRMLPILARWRGFHVLGHGHPRAMKRLRAEYEKLGIEVVEDFNEVMRRADVYVCDNSSTIYEFCVTGKPVVLLNAPEYRKNVHSGIRFWDYTDVGPCIDDPNELLGAVLHALTPLSTPLSRSTETSPQKDGESTAILGGEWYEARAKAVRELYPFLGESAERAARVLREWMNGE
jgi:hypothetical protein